MKYCYDKLLSMMNHEFEHVDDWLIGNKLSFERYKS